MENESNQIIENEKEGLGCFAITAISIFILGIIIVIIMLGIAFSNKPTSSLNDPNNDTAIINPFKEPPTLSSEQNFSSIIFNIQCNDNYSYVILRIEFLDKNKNKIKKEKMYCPGNPEQFIKCLKTAFLKGQHFFL